MATHHLKTWPQYFSKVLIDEKTFEVRLDDRDFKTGDTLVLQEWCPGTEQFTGRECQRIVTYITNYGQLKGHVVMAIKPPTNLVILT
jgi:hypothetical protein